MAKVIKPILPQLILILFASFILFITPYQVEISKSSGQWPRIFPYFLGITIIVLSFITLVSNLVHQQRRAIKQDEKIKEQEEKKYLRVVGVLLILVLWAVLLMNVGFIISTFLLILSIMLLLGVRRVLTLVLTPSLFTVVIYYVFKVLLKIPLPEGLLM